MKKYLLKIFANVALWVVIVGSIVFGLCFGISLKLIKKEVSNWSDRQAELSTAYIRSYVDGQFKAVEDVAFTFASDLLGKCTRTEDGEGTPIIDESMFSEPTEEEMFALLDRFLETNPNVCGIAVGLESSVGHYVEGPFGAAFYATDVSGEIKHLMLGNIHNYREKEWYRNAAAKGESYWSLPFRETSMNKVVTCFSVPLRGSDSKIIGVLAIDIDTEAFREKCIEAAPFPGADICLIDRENRFISHQDTSLILTDASVVEKYSVVCKEDISSPTNEMKSLEDEDTIFYLARIKRNGWKVCAEFKKESVFGSVDNMKKKFSIVELFCLVFMGLCFTWLFIKLNKATVTKASMDNELNMASGIQMGMLKESSPVFEAAGNLDIHALMRPARVVGGDLYDYCLRDNKLYFCVGDVSGKGVPASLFMMVVLALFRNLTAHLDTAAQIVNSLNSTVAAGNTESMFCTMFVGILDLETGRLDTCSAGHNAPVLNGRFLKPESQLPLAVYEGIPYRGTETTMEQGDCLVIYTDGVTEAENSEKVLFGDDNLIAACKEADGSWNAEMVANSILDKVREHVGTAEQNDDLTMMVIKFGKAEERKA